MRGIVRVTELPSCYGGDPRIMPAAPKNGNQRDLTKESVSLFSGSSFASKEEPRCGARSPTLFLAAVLRGKQSYERLGYSSKVQSFRLA